MFTLGIHGGINTARDFTLPTPVNWLHDAAAVLCRDGEVVAAAEEERFTRIKHVSFFPVEAIRYCLDSQHLTLADVEWIVLSSDHMNDFLRMVNNWRHGTRGWLAENRYARVASDVLARDFGVDTQDTLLFAGHHRSHALSAVWQSGFAECLCVVLDGWGDGLTGLIASFRDGQLTIVRTLSEIGPAGLYLTGTEIIGFSQFEEYKVMGLAPYGDPEQARSDGARLIACRDQGESAVLLPEMTRLAEERRAFRVRDAAIEPRHVNFAAALQSAAEHAFLHLLRYVQYETGHEHLALAGGFAQNCTANGKVIASGLFKEVFVQPAAYDAGCAIGAAMHGYLHAGGRMTSQRLAHVYWGADTPPRQTLERLFHAWNAMIDVQEPEDICDTAAQLIADGCLIGWMQGRAEFGARALGNRSILADPRPAANKDRINALVKKREAFRPFAPSVQEECLHAYFEVPAGVDALPFMVVVVPVREPYRTLLGAVTHVDGTARVQSVSKSSNERYWRLLDAFRARTGLPVVLNTSFNINAEPIVNSASDALNCFLSTGIDHLIIGDYLISRKIPAGDASIIYALVPRLSCRFALTRTSSVCGRVTRNLQDRYTNEVLPISPEAYDALMEALDRHATFDAVIDRTSARAPHLARELFELWQHRVFVGAMPCAFDRDDVLTR
jgi:carbamoyltransferase